MLTVLFFYPIQILILWLLQLISSFGGRAAEVSHVSKVEVGAGAVTAETGNVGDRQRGVLQQFVGHAALVGLAEIDTAHSCEQEHERIDVIDAGTVAFAEDGGVGTAAREEAQIVVHHADARWVEVAFQRQVLDSSVLAVAAAMGEGRNIELFERKLRLALELAGVQAVPASPCVVAIPPVFYSVSHVPLRL